nr:retrovirus-related Pol polyprotein from transposon TNT 1-94 [Tanacetum cinerariifolium]
MPNPEDITDPTIAMNMALTLIAKAFKINYSTPINNNQRISSNPRNRQIAQPGMNMGQDRQMQMVRDNGENQFRQYAGQNVGDLNVGNQTGNGNLVATHAEGNAAGHNGNQIRCYNCRGVGYFARIYTVRPRRRDAAYLQTQLLIAQKEEAGIQLQAEEFDLMAAAADLDEIKEVNANCILMANLQQASNSGTQTDKDPVYDSDGSAEVHDCENYDDNEIFNMFTQEEQYTELLEPIPEQHQVPQNDNDVISKVTSVEQSGETVEQHPANFKEIHELLDKQIQLEKKIKELNNILVKTGQSIQTIHMLSPKPDSFYHTGQKITLGYQNPFYLKQAQKKQQSLYDGKVLLEKHDPPVVHDSEETLQLAQKTDESLAKQKALELEIERLFRAVVSQDIMSIVQKESVVDTSNLQTELEPYKDMKQKIERLQAQLGDLKGKSKDTSCVSDTLNPLSQKLENENVELEFQALNYARENAHLKSTYKNLFDSISDKTRGTSKNTKFAKQSILGKPPMLGEIHALAKPVTLNSILTPQESKVVKNDKVISLGMFRINPFKTSREEKHVPNNVRASARTKPITVSQHPVITKKDVTSDSNGLSSTGIDNTKTRRPQHRSNTKSDRVPSASKSSRSKSFGDLQWGNILITRVYFIEGLGHNLFLGVDLLKRDRSTNLYTINLHEMASASPICLMARASSTKLWLWHQRLSHLNFDTINNLARNDLVSGLPKLKYHKEHLCPSCEQGKSKRASRPPKHVPNSRQRLHLLHMDLCGPMRIASINGKRITVLLQSLVIIIRTDNGTEFKNQVLKEYFDYIGISHQMSSVQTPQQNRVVERRNQTLVEAARTMLIFSRAPLFLWAEAIATACFTQNRSIIHPRFNKTSYELINGRKPNISFLHVFGALCYPKNDHEDIRKLGAKDTAPTPTNSSSHATKFPINSQDVDELNSQQQHVQQQGNQAHLQAKTVADNVPNAMFDANTFDHPLEQVIGEPSRPVSTKNQLLFDGDMCMYALTVSTMEPKNVKEAMTDPAWIESMQEELLQFKRLD